MQLPHNTSPLRKPCGGERSVSPRAGSGAQYQPHLTSAGSGCLVERRLTSAGEGRHYSQGPAREREAWFPPDIGGKVTEDGCREGDKSGGGGGRVKRDACGSRTAQNGGRRSRFGCGISGGSGFKEQEAGVVQEESEGTEGEGQRTGGAGSQQDMYSTHHHATLTIIVY